MKQSLINRLLEGQQKKEAIALVTDLDNGTKAIAYPNMMHGEFTLPTPIFNKVRERVEKDKSGLVEEQNLRLFVQCFLPPLRLIIVGGIYIAPYLAQLAETTGFQVTIIEPRKEFLNDLSQYGNAKIVIDDPANALSELNPDGRTAILTISHDPRIDDPALHIALKSSAFFIGAMGSKKAHTSRIERLSAENFSVGEIGRIHNPLGIGIGASHEAELALSVLAQITATLRGGSVVTSKKK